MHYISTRGEAAASRFSDAVAVGLAPDGGLFLPDRLPDLSPHLEAWSHLGYPELCLAFFSEFADDMESNVLESCIQSAYSDFAEGEIAPVRQLGDHTWVLELFHGPTLAFKDFALQVLGNLYGAQIQRTGEPINVLGATSGDTGAAAIQGLAGTPGVNTFILYPLGRVSPLQERQMICTEDPHVFPLGIEGSFDDAQAALKSLFSDQGFRIRNRLSAVNSINLVRILAQCVYYLWAWFRLPPAIRDTIEVVVPTGNFGNIFAGWILRKMGVPFSRFRLATNQNDILYRLMNQGEYVQEPVRPSLAPSMDIQVASNFERFLYYFCQEDPARVRQIIETFRQSGAYHFDHFVAEGFSASRAIDEEIVRLIQQAKASFDYVADPHTACGFKDLDPDRPSLLVATAHPAKFPDTIERAIGLHPAHPRLEVLKQKQARYYPVDPTPEAIGSFIESHPAGL